MTPDPIVEEVRRAREARAARFNFDLLAIAEDVRNREKQSGRTVVCPAPRTDQIRSADEHGPIERRLKD